MTSPTEAATASTELNRRYQIGSLWRRATNGVAVQSTNVATLARPWPTSDAVAAGSLPGCGHCGSLTWISPATMVVVPAICTIRARSESGTGMSKVEMPRARKPGTPDPGGLADQTDRASLSHWLSGGSRLAYQRTGCQGTLLDTVRMSIARWTAPCSFRAEWRQSRTWPPGSPGTGGAAGRYISTRSSLTETDGGPVNSPAKRAMVNSN